MSKLTSFIYRLRGEVTTEDLIQRGLVVGSGFKRLNHVIIDDSHANLITIGNNVTLAPRVHILAHDASTKHALGKTRIGLVTIGNNVFVGAGTIILPGVSIGDNVVIGAGSVVTKSIPSDSVSVGNPAQIIGSFDDYISKKHVEMKNTPIFDASFTLRNNASSEKLLKMKEILIINGGIGYVE